MTASRLMGLLAAAFAAHGVEAQDGERVADGRRLAPTGIVRIYNPAGTIRVATWARDSVAVTGTVASGGTKLLMLGGESVARAIVMVPDVAKPGLSHLDVQVPPGSRLWIKSGGASIDVSGVRGVVEIISGGGDVRVTASPRELSAETMAGALRITGDVGRLRARTATGELSVEGRVDDAQLSTVSGAVWLVGGPVSRARVESVTGPIAFIGALGRDVALDLISHSGSITLGFTQPASAEFDVESIEGEIKSGLAGAKPTREANGARRYVKEGDAGRVSVRTFKGDVTLRPKVKMATRTSPGN